MKAKLISGLDNGKANDLDVIAVTFLKISSPSVLFDLHIFTTDCVSFCWKNK